MHQLCRGGRDQRGRKRGGGKLAEAVAKFKKEKENKVFSFFFFKCISWEPTSFLQGRKEEGPFLLHWVSGGALSYYPCVCVGFFLGGGAPGSTRTEGGWGWGVCRVRESKFRSFVAFFLPPPPFPFSWNQNVGKVKSFFFYQHLDVSKCPCSKCGFSFFFHRHLTLFLLLLIIMNFLHLFVLTVLPTEHFICHTFKMLNLLRS